MNEFSNVERDFLYYVIVSAENMGNIMSSGFKSYYMDFENSGFSPTRTLFDISTKFYSKYRNLLNRENLPVFLTAEHFTQEQQNQLLLLFEEVLSTVPNLEFLFIMDLIRKNYAKAILHKKLNAGIDAIIANDLDRSMKIMKEGIFTAENVFNSESKEGTIQESTNARRQNYSEVKNGKAVGLPSGFPTFDRLTGGLKGGELIIVVAGTKEGKSTFLLNVAYYLQAKMNKNVFFLSAENPRVQLERRYDSLHSGIPCSNVRDAHCSPEEEAHYYKCLEEVRNMPGIFYVWDNPVSTPEGIDAKMLELESKFKFDAIFVDYLSLVKPKVPSGDLQVDVGNAALELRTIARRRNIPVITASQVNRIATKRNSPAYENTDVSYSYSIVHHADTVITLRVQNPDMLNSGGGTCDILARLTKCRDGAQGEFSIDAYFEKMKLKERSFIIK